MVLQSEDFRKFPIFDAFLKPHFDVGHMGRGQGTAELNEMVQYSREIVVYTWFLQIKGTIGAEKRSQKPE